MSLKTNNIMLFKLRLFAYILALCTPISTSAELPQTLRLAATDWCPYSCNSENQPGIVTEYITQMLAPYNINVKVQILPWSRAIRNANKGDVAGLLTAVPSEAPDLRFTTVPTMSYRVCFFSREESDWSFNTSTSLENRTLGASLNYSYGEEVDPYIQKNNDNRFVYLISGDDKIARFSAMLRSNRLDSFIEDQYVAEWKMNKLKVKPDGIKNSGCLPSHPFFFAINPDLAWGDELIDLLNQLFSKDENKVLLQKIIQRYITN